MVIFYSLDIFRRAEVELDNYVLSILAQSGISLGYILAPLLMNRVSRKKHFLSAGIFMVCNLLIASFVIYFEVCTIK